MDSVVVDCDEGRRLGCATFCCRLLVRLRADEQDPGNPQGPGKSCVDKDPETGRCVYVDADTGRCGIWESRPAICRSYDCNRDPLLQIVLRDGFTSLVTLVKSQPVRGPTRRVPYVTADRNGEPSG